MFLEKQLPDGPKIVAEDNFLKHLPQSWPLEEEKHTADKDWSCYATSLNQFM